MGYSTQFLSPGGFKRLGTPSTKFQEFEKTRDFGHLWPFSWAIAHNFGLWVDINDPGPHHTSFTKPLKTHDFGHFWPFSWAIAHRFWLQGGFNWLDTSFTIGKKLVISGIFGRFRGL